jgi:ribosomal protein S18 acetylase RimI-like enzyme
MNTPDRITHLRTNFESVLHVAGIGMAPDKIEHSPRYTRCLTGAPHPLANLVIAAKQTEEEFTALLEDTERWAKAHQRPVALILFPGIGEPERPAWALARGWQLLDNMPGMWLERTEDFGVGPTPAGVTVRHADDDAALEQTCRVVEQGYPVPLEAAEFFVRGIHLGNRADRAAANFLATVDGEPAACAAVCVSEGVAGIYCVATLERFRGRGLGALVTRAAVEHGFRHRARHALLHATAMGEPVYRKIGFAELCRIPAYGFGLG